MQLRDVLEPDLKTAEKHYQTILDAILQYTDFCDQNGDEGFSEYEKLELELNLLTGKDMSMYNLAEWWEEEGAEPLAFKISLPDPLIIDDISKEELKEIVTRLKTCIAPSEEDGSFHSQFYFHLDDYYHSLLSLNFGGYELKLFQRNKDKSGNYFEYPVDDIVERIWS